jgi:hypothetical protein
MDDQNSMPQWKGLFDWSMRYQDGTRPTDMASATADPEKMKWCAAVIVVWVQFCTHGSQTKPSVDLSLILRQAA